MSWAVKEAINKIVSQEDGYITFPAGQRTPFALVYPNSYHVGMSNLGIHILYKGLNERKDIACERFFLPDKMLEVEYIRSNTPLLSMETQLPLQKFPLIGFSISFEMDYFNIVKILAMGKVKVFASERGDLDPIVIAGGPCATFNSEPLSDFIDVFVIGEGETTIQHLMDKYIEGIDNGLSRDEILFLFTKIEGIYVPKFYQHEFDADNRLCITHQEGVPDRVKRQWVENLDDFDAKTVIFTEKTEFGSLCLLEIARGCGRHCRFCMAGYCFRKPRVRSLTRLKADLEEIKKVGKKVGLMGAAISDYPEVDVLCKDILGLDMSMSVASLRADSITEALADSLAKSGLRTITLAPEAGSERMRNVINKGITEDDLFHAITLALKAGIPNLKLYIMIGLPFETDEDIEAIIDMAKKIKEYRLALKSKGLITLSINPFIPKPFTPFQWLPMDNLKTIDQKLKHIKQALKSIRGIEVIAESTKEAYVQGILARGDRRLGKIIYEAYKAGGSKQFRKILQEHGLDESFYLYNTREKTDVLPWDTLHMGFESDYLYNELLKAVEQKKTLKCFDGCSRCGICKNNK